MAGRTDRDAPVRSGGSIGMCASRSHLIPLTVRPFLLRLTLTIRPLHPNTATLGDLRGPGGDPSIAAHLRRSFLEVIVVGDRPTLSSLALRTTLLAVSAADPSAQDREPRPGLIVDIRHSRIEQSIPLYLQAFPLAIDVGCRG